MQLHQYFSYVSRGAHSLLRLSVTEEIAWHLRRDRSEPKSGGLCLSESYFFFFFFFSSYSTFMLFPLKYLLATALPFVGSLGPMEKHWWALSEWQAFCSKCASHLWSDCYHRDHKLTTGDKQAKNSKKVSEHKWKERIPASHLKATAFPSTWPSSQHELQILKI